jgi:hypothetical protein
MKPLSTLRTSERDTRAIEIAATRSLTVAASVAAYRSLYAACAAQLDATEDLFRADRERYLCQLQATLRRLAEHHGDGRG